MLGVLKHLLHVGVARSPALRACFSDLAKLPGEEQVDIIAWGPPKFGKIFFFSCEFSARLWNDIR